MRQAERKGQVFLLGLASFLNDASSEMPAPILPVLLTGLGGGGISVGLVGGLRDLVSRFLQVYFGWLSDRLGKRRPFVLAGYFVSGLFKLLLAWAGHPWQVVTTSALERLGKAIRTAPRDAIIAEAMPKRRGAAFGLHRAMDTAGAVFGSLLVLLLFWGKGITTRSLIVLAAFLSFSSLVPLSFVRERKNPGRPEGFLSGIRALPPPFGRYLAAAGIFSLANFSYMFFLLKAQHALDNSQTVVWTLSLYLCFNVFYSIFAYPAGVLSDRFGRKGIIALGYLLFSGICAGFLWAKGLPSFFFLFFLYGLSYALLEGNQRAYAADLAPAELRGTAVGLFHTVVGLCALPGNLLAGILWEMNESFPFLYGVILSLVAVLALMVVKDRGWKP